VTGPGLALRPMRRGRAVQVDSVKTRLESAYGFKHLRVKCDDLLSNFALKFNLRRYAGGLVNRGDHHRSGEQLFHSKLSDYL